MHIKSRILQGVAVIVLAVGTLAVVAGPAAAHPKGGGGGGGGGGGSPQTLIVSNQPAQSSSSQGHNRGGGGWNHGGGGWNNGWNCRHAQYTTINSAVTAAAPGDAVVVCPGTYTEDVVIQKALTLIGQGATINATGLVGTSTGAIIGQDPYNGITIESSDVTVRGFTVEGAEGEGILAVNPDPVAATVGGMALHTGTPITNVTIEDNDVTGNDLGFNSATSPTRRALRRVAPTAARGST